MDNYDDILEDYNQSSRENANYKSSYSKNNWQEQQNRERQEAYDKMDKMSEIIQKDGEKFRSYLDIQSRFEKYSVGNCLLILDEFPKAIQFRDKKSWNDKGIDLIDNAKSITILEPSRSKKNNRVYYNPKQVYDISQTNAKQAEMKSYDDRTLLKAFLNNCTAERKAVDTLPDSDVQGAEYNKDENVLYVCRGMDKETLFQSLSQELSNIEMKDIENSNFKSFKSYCVSYMLCKQYGIDVSNYDFKDLPEEITNKKSGKDVRAELNDIRVKYERLSSRVRDYFEQADKQRKYKVQER